MSRQTVLAHRFHSYAYPPRGDGGALALLSTAAEAACLPNVYQQHHHRNNLQRLPLRPAELPAGFHTSPFHPRQHAVTTSTMSNAGAYQPSEQELADLQKLSSEYEPEVTGPLVSERQSTTAITAEYANGDPIYRAKTAILPQEFPEYRSCRGDGHCGWRAVAFTYFEALQRVGDKNKFLEEETRLRSLRNLLNSVGLQEHIYEDFADATFDLLRATSNALPNTDNSAALLASFNDDNTAMSIITYLKFLTSAWIKTHPEDYQPFLLGQSIDEFCNTHVEAAMCEIEHIGLTALTEVLIKPASLAMEVMYLDRSPGEKMTHYQFNPVGIDGSPLPAAVTLRLLYRPGHYDILYTADDIQRMAPPPPPQPVPDPVYVGLVGGTTEYIPSGRHAPNIAAYIPGMSFYDGPSFGTQEWASTDAFFPNSSAIPVQPMPALPSHFDTVPHISAPMHDFIPPPTSVEQTPAVSMHQPHGADRNVGVFRPSAYELEPLFGAGQQTSNQFQTSIFRNSHFNTAHYLNPDFQPEEWTPDAEYGTSRGKHK